jgi:hypothetical protein
MQQLAAVPPCCDHTSKHCVHSTPRVSLYAGLTCGIELHTVILRLLQRDVMTQSVLVDVPDDGGAAEPIVNALPLCSDAHQLPPVVYGKKQVDVSPQCI